MEGDWWRGPTSRPWYGMARGVPGIRPGLPPTPPASCVFAPSYLRAARSSLLAHRRSLRARGLVDSGAGDRRGRRVRHDRRFTLGRRDRRDRRDRRGRRGRRDRRDRRDRLDRRNRRGARSAAASARSVGRPPTSRFFLSFPRPASSVSLRSSRLVRLVSCVPSVRPASFVSSRASTFTSCVTTSFFVATTWSRLRTKISLPAERPPLPGSRSHAASGSRVTPWRQLGSRSIINRPVATTVSPPDPDSLASARSPLWRRHGLGSGSDRRARNAGWWPSRRARSPARGWGRPERPRGTVGPAADTSLSEVTRILRFDSDVARPIA